MTAPVWAPTVAQVAGYVPHRTLVRADASTIQSDDTYQFTFDTTTIPTATQVTQLIEDGCVWVSTLVTPLNTVSEPLGALIAALWAAIAIERSWPDDDDSLQRANDMEKQLNTMLAQLKQSNSDANNGTDDGFDIVFPVWNFECPSTDFSNL